MQLTADKKLKNREYYLKNKEVFKERSRLRREAGLDQRNIIVERKSSIKRKYGIDWTQFVELFNNANGLCEICQKPLQLAGKKGDDIESASIDHCHISGKIRGILCRNCNVALGHFKDSRLHLMAALKYLDKHDSHG